MTYKQLREEIEAWHRATYPEPDAKVWPLCVAKVVEELDEYINEMADDECADVIIASMAAQFRGTEKQVIALSRVVQSADDFCHGFAFKCDDKYHRFPDWLESRWNEVKQRTPEVQRARDKERGIEIGS